MPRLIHSLPFRPPGFPISKFWGNNFNTIRRMRRFNRKLAAFNSVTCHPPRNSFFSRVFIINSSKIFGYGLGRRSKRKQNAGERRGKKKRVKHRASEREREGGEKGKKGGRKKEDAKFAKGRGGRGREAWKRESRRAVGRSNEKKKKERKKRKKIKKGKKRRKKEGKKKFQQYTLRSRNSIYNMTAAIRF